MNRYYFLVLIFVLLILIVGAFRYRTWIVHVVLPQFLCLHEHVRCIHGDEILYTAKGWRKSKFARTRCLDCGRALYNIPMPEVCYVTKQQHGWVRGKTISSQYLAKKNDI